MNRNISQEDHNKNDDLNNYEINSLYIHDLKSLYDYNENNLNNEIVFNINMSSAKTNDTENTNCDVGITDIWLTIPLIFPVATLHNISTPGDHSYSELIGGSLCFSPEYIDVPRIFSTIQGITDIGATFFQIVIAKLVGVTVDNIEIIKNEFNEVFGNESFNEDDFISVRPIGWRKRNDYIMNSTIPFKKSLSLVPSEEQKSFYNSILILEDNLDNCNKKLLKLGTLVDSFLERIKITSPLIEIIKVTDVKKNNSFEVTFRIQPMLSYISEDGEDFEINCGLSSEFYDCKHNSSSVHLGDIRLINPHDFEIDNRVSCGLFKTFSLISENTLFKLSNLPFASYTPFVGTNKKLNQQNNKLNSLNSTKQLSFQRSVDKNNTLSPDMSIFYDKNEFLIKTPPPTSVLSNNSTRYCSTGSKSDLRYNYTVSRNHVTKKSISCTSSISSLNGVTSTPFSSSITEFECSPWMNSDRITSSFLSSRRELQKPVSPGISSVSFMNGFYSMSDMQLLAIPPNLNPHNEDISDFNCNESFNGHSFELNSEDFKSVFSLSISDSFIDQFEGQTSRSSQNEQDTHDNCSSKDSDIIDLLDNIFSDEIRENIINDLKYKLSDLEDFNEDKENINKFNIGNNTIFSSEQMFDNNNYKFDYWGFEKFTNNLTSNKEQNDLNMTSDSGFLPCNDSTKLNICSFL
ncbi:hypothetical protein FG386_000876 [Cryptosporidium ryanae]|uniref:uncharacterized protein n=1 Tax=Cryptosporidium ryanae TaxID=515981 RepID=UPI003519F067|nr:hypothetical protein FG386_000876 [Cryptosporidium ryanae]